MDIYRILYQNQHGDLSQQGEHVAPGLWINGSRHNHEAERWRVWSFFFLTYQRIVLVVKFNVTIKPETI